MTNDKRGMTNDKRGMRNEKHQCATENSLCLIRSREPAIRAIFCPSDQKDAAAIRANNATFKENTIFTAILQSSANTLTFSWHLLYNRTFNL